MNQFFKIALDYPAKAEKVFLWVLQSLLVFWILSSIFNIDFGLCLTNIEDAFITSDCLKAISAIDIATYIIVYVLTWFIVWEFLADLIVRLIFFLLNKVIRLIWLGIIEILYHIFFAIKYCLSYISIGKKPKYKKKDKVEDTGIEYYDKMLQLRKSLEAFAFMNKVTDSAVGSINLLNIISHEKGQFIQSRVIRYYTILLAVVLIKASEQSFSNLSTLTVIALVICILLGFVVFGINDIYSRLNTDDVHFLIPELKFDIYKDFIYQSVSNSILIDDYKVKNKRRFVELVLKDDEKTNELQKEYYKGILFVPIDNKRNNLNQIINRFKNNDNTLIVIVSNFEIKLFDRNRIVAEKFCHIQTTDRNQFIEAILTLRPIFIGSVKL